MRFSPPLESGTLVRRYKRFLADVEVAGHGVVTMHCANTGAMRGCATPGSRVWFSTSTARRRKYAHSLELVATHDGDAAGLACVNTGRANPIVGEALNAGRIPGLPAGPVRAEPPIPDLDLAAAGRFDFAVGGELPMFLEVKSVTLCRKGIGAFPDAVSERAKRHALALARCAEAGHRATLLFCAMHTGIRQVTAADDIDPSYGAALRAAAAAGVEVTAWSCRIEPGELALANPLPVVL